MEHSLDGLRLKINDAYRQPEADKMAELLDGLTFDATETQRATDRAVALIDKVRRHPGDRTLLEDFMQRYALSTQEGVALMGLAESLLRIPDAATADALIVDKLTHNNWNHHDATDQKLLTILSGWGLSLSGQILDQADSTLGRLVKRVGLPVIRSAAMQAVKLLGGQFVAGKDLSAALRHTRTGDAADYLYSFDMLGEGARTALKANDYFTHYKHAITALGDAQTAQADLSPFAKDSISVKLSALHPRYEEAQKDRCLPVIIARVLELAKLAKRYDIMLTLDAEEADRLELSLDVFAAVFTHSDLRDYHGFGLAVQAYQKRCHAVVRWLAALAATQAKTIPVRLVKGAYWDGEIKKAQDRGLSGYPVYTRKNNTDVAYLVAADMLLASGGTLYPQFATHNAMTIAQILELAARHGQPAFEFQRLHGMGDPLYAALREHGVHAPCRVYAPVGPYQDLLPYLVRRLLENGANSSFVNHIYDADIVPHDLARDPLTVARAQTTHAHPAIPLPADLYPDRRNSVTYDLSDRADQAHLQHIIDTHKQTIWTLQAALPEVVDAATVRAVYSPADPSHKIGMVTDVSPEHVDPVMQDLAAEFPRWNATPLQQRADILDRIADELTARQDELFALCVYEAGKTYADALAEIREAVDFCRYYAARGRRDLRAEILPGPAGERNEARYEGRGVFLCISPWNFPLAIFMGQIAAALVAGNCVVAKPAPQTGLIAALAVRIMQDSGLPHDVLTLMPGDAALGARLVAHPLVGGVAFTGSTQTARHIQRALAAKDGPIIPFIAETGGQNVMIVDSSALPEQVVDDVLRSGIHSAGQRCSALRVLYLQDDIAPDILNMLRGALAELRVGDPVALTTDVGPVIDRAACDRLQAHLDAMPLPLMQAADVPHKGTFIAPTILPLSNIADLTAEHFGPVIHVVQFAEAEKDALIDRINAYGYGLTLGVHSRIEDFIDRIVARARVGNIYINRGMTGAVVGVQPFGGMGLSGTGPKAGGADYLKRFAVEKTVTVNLTAVGGNTTLATLEQT